MEGTSEEEDSPIALATLKENRPLTNVPLFSSQCSHCHMQLHFRAVGDVVLVECYQCHGKTSFDLKRFAGALHRPPPRPDYPTAENDPGDVVDDITKRPPGQRFWIMFLVCILLLAFTTACLFLFPLALILLVPISCCSGCGSLAVSMRLPEENRDSRKYGLLMRLLAAVVFGVTVVIAVLWLECTNGDSWLSCAQQKG